MNFDVTFGYKASKNSFSYQNKFCDRPSI